jgi:glycosyltransferase involved in cell wall biosynthesis
MIITVIFYIFVAVAVIQMLYYLSFSVFAFTKKTLQKNEELPSVSVVICAKNEAENLQRFIPTILAQKYPKFELVLIDDASSDDTLEVMQAFKEQDPRIKVVPVDHNEAFWGSKKYALTLGIKAASYEHLLFTDADCTPVSKHWIEEMSAQFNTKKQLVLGYGRLKKAPQSFTNILARYETLITAIQYFSYAKLGSPYMGVGRNLAYTKSAFFKVNGFVKHLHIRSGDDDLFVQEVAHKNNTAICFSEAGTTESEAPKNFAAWFRQKRRHVSTAKHYAFKYQLLLGSFFMTKLLLFSLFGFLLFNMNWQLPVLIISLYYLIQWVVIGFSAKKLQEFSLVFFLPILEISLLIFQFAIFMANSVSKPNHWK